MTETTVDELMTTRVISVHPDSPAAEVVTRLHAYRISCLVVCEKRLPVGIITERDIVGLVFRKRRLRRAGRERRGLRRRSRR